MLGLELSINTYACIFQCHTIPPIFKGIRHGSQDNTEGRPKTVFWPNNNKFGSLASGIKIGSSLDSLPFLVHVSVSASCTCERNKI